MKKFAIIITVTLAAGIILFGYSQKVNSSLSQKIVRLHVIANSNTSEDQSLKLKIRDAILEKSSSDFTKKKDVTKNLDVYRDIAEKIIAENGFGYSVNVEYGNFHFPTKNYKNLSLPAGNYDAVRVVIGDGAGENWWCVLFPPLCYVDGTTDDSEADEKLRSMLEKSDYDLISAGNGSGNIPVEIKFKIVEFYGKLKNHTTVYARSRKDKQNENENTKPSSKKA